MWFVLEIDEPSCLRSIKNCVMPCLDVESESVNVYVRGSGLETPVADFVKIDVVEDDDLGRGDKGALKVRVEAGDLESEIKLRMCSPAKNSKLDGARLSEWEPPQ